MVILVLLVLVLLVVIGGTTALVVVLIRRVGTAQQRQYDAEVSQFIAGTQPDAAFQQRQAEIEKNLADADALAARLEVEEPAAQTPVQPPPPTPPAAAPPDPTL